MIAKVMAGAIISVRRFANDLPVHEWCSRVKNGDCGDNQRVIGSYSRQSLDLSKTFTRRDFFSVIVTDVRHRDTVLPCVSTSTKTRRAYGSGPCPMTVLAPWSAHHRAFGRRSKPM